MKELKYSNYSLNRKPEVKRRQGRHSGKPTNRYLSERRFVKALGVAAKAARMLFRALVGGIGNCQDNNCPDRL